MYEHISGHLWSYITIRHHVSTMLMYDHIWPYKKITWSHMMWWNTRACIRHPPPPHLPPSHPLSPPPLKLSPHPPPLPASPPPTINQTNHWSNKSSINWHYLSGMSWDNCEVLLAAHMLYVIACVPNSKCSVSLICLEMLRSKWKTWNEERDQLVSGTAGFAEAMLEYIQGHTLPQTR